MRFDNEKLMLILAQKGMSFKQFCKSAGISENGLRAIRRGEAQPRTITLYKIANALGVEVDEIVEWGELIEKDGKRYE